MSFPFFSDFWSNYLLATAANKRYERNLPFDRGWESLYLGFIKLDEIQEHKQLENIALSVQLERQAHTKDV